MAMAETRLLVCIRIRRQVDETRPARPRYSKGIDRAQFLERKTAIFKPTCFSHILKLSYIAEPTALGAIAHPTIIPLVQTYLFFLLRQPLSQGKPVANMTQN
jgi:hypothetical protein